MQQMAKQMIDFQKTTFNNTFASLVTLQEQSEKMVATFLDQSPMPKEGKEAMENWLKMCKEARDNFKKAVDEGYENLEKYFQSEA